MQTVDLKRMPPAPLTPVPLIKTEVDLSNPVIVGIQKVFELDPARFFYLATPFSGYVHGHIRAAEHAAQVAGALVEHTEVNIFSPIAHGHMLRAHMTPRPHAWWMGVDRPYMDAALGLIVAKLPGWDRSDGVQTEMMYFAQHLKPVFVVHVEMRDDGEIVRLG